MRQKILVISFQIALCDVSFCSGFDLGRHAECDERRNRRTDHAPIFAAFFNVGTGFTTEFILYTIVFVIVFSIIVDYFTILLANVIGFFGAIVDFQEVLIKLAENLFPGSGGPLKHLDAFSNFVGSPPYDQELISYARDELLAPYPGSKLSNSELDKAVYAWLCQNDRIGYTIEENQSNVGKTTMGAKHRSALSVIFGSLRSRKYLRVLLRIVRSYSLSLF